MAQGNLFPAFIKVETDTRAIDQLEGKLLAFAKNAPDEFGKSFGQIRSIIDGALSSSRNSVGSLDLGVEQIKAAAKASEARAIAAREVAEATRRVSAADNVGLAALEAYERETRQAAQADQERARAAELVQNELNKVKSATDAVVIASGRGTTAYQANTQSVRAMRQATTQAGQQLQDIVISMGSGQRASTVLAQQLPQLAFAFSDVGGKVGAVARFLSGPWGVAIAIGAFALGPLIDGLFKTEKSSDAAKKSTYDFTQAFNIQKVAIDEVANAMEQLNNQTKQLIEGNKLLADQGLVVAKNSLAGLETRKAALDKEISDLVKKLNAGQGGFDITGQVSGSLRLTELKRQRDELAKGLGDARQSVENADIAASQLRVNEAIDAGTKATNDYNRKLNELNELRRQGIRYEQDPLAASRDADVGGVRASVGQKEYEKRLRAAKEEFELAKKTASERERSSDRDTRSRAQVLADFRRELESRGVDTISGYRTAAQQNALFKQNLTPADGYKVPSRHQSFRAVDIDKNTFNERAIYEAGQAAGIRGLRILNESGGRKHLDFTGSGKPGTVDDKAAERQARELERSERAATALQNNLDQISTTVTRIGGEFDRQPRFIDRATLASEKLRQVIADIDKNLASADLSEEQRAKQIEKRAEAKRTLEVEIPRAVRQPFDDVTKQSERELELQNLRLAGREVEAQLLQSQFDLMQRYNAETEEELATALAKAGITKQEYLTQLDIQKVLLTNRNIEQERLALLGQTIEDRISRLNELRESAISTIADAAATGNVSFKNIFDTINRQFADQFARKFFDQFLGGAFQSEEDRLRNLKNRADGQLIVSTTRVADAMDSLAASAQGLATGTPANDNLSSDAADVRQEAAIIVSGVRNGNKDFARLITKSLEGLLGEGSVLASDIGSAVSGALEGAQLGGFLGSAFGSGGGKIGRGLGAILGGANSLVGGAGPLASVFAALPQVGAVLQASSAISSLLGNDQVKGGKTIGVIAPFLTALFGSSLRGSATIGGVNGSLGVTGTRGNSKSRKASATDSANTVIEQINAIAEQLGGGLNASAGSASIGIRKKNFILDPTGQGRTKGAGTINFGKDEKAAIAAARALALDLINDGVITGLRAGSQKLLANAKSLEAGLEKALKFQSVFDRLEAIKNPLGAAVGTLNKEFTGLISIFREAGASAEEFAQLEELYGLERQKVIEEQSEALTGSLRQLIEDLKQGENGLALRDRLANIRSQFDPLANTIRGGGVVDYDRFSELARQLIDVQRQISGSQIDYFAVFNEILGLSEQALAGQQNVVSIGSGLTSPFSGTSAPSNASTPVVGAIQSQTTTIVASLAAIQAQIANQNFAPSRLYASNGFSLGGTTYF